MKLKRLIKCERDSDGEVVPGTDQLVGYMILCPGCKGHHAIHTEEPNGSGARWTFNDNMEKPTFGAFKNDGLSSVKVVGHCHFWVTDGMVTFASDSEHMPNQTLSLLDFEENTDEHP